ncbi:MAG: acyl carrier protein [Flammeovirgaceae bacterium]|jgi:8-amino-7-oxononanoate synthase|nr:acyl carrier protein [Flammeovirgaceae bacterium]
MNTFTETELIDFFRKKIASELGIALEEVEVDLEFINFGLDSVNAIFILQHIEKFIGADLNPLLLWDYPTIESFSRYIVSTLKKN